MGKSMASAWPGSCLIVALAVIVCLAHSFSPVDGSLTDRTAEEWVEQKEGCLEELNAIDEESKANWVHDATNWLANSKGISEQTDCNEDYKFNILTWRDESKGFEKCQTLMNDYLELYLNKCRLEENFAQVIANIEQIPQIDLEIVKYKTLYSYIASKSWGKDDVWRVLHVIKKVPLKVNCDKQKVRDLVRWVVDRSRYEAVREFAFYYYAFFLKKCGHEGNFEKAIIKLGRVLNKHSDSDKYKTLYGYLVDADPDLWIVERLLSAVKEYSEFEPASEGIDCTQEHRTKLVKLFVASCPVEGLHEFVGDYFARFLQECGFEDHFRTAIDTSKLFAEEKWDSHTTLYSFVEESCDIPRSHEPVDERISVVEKISELSSISIFKTISKPDKSTIQTDCTSEHSTRLWKLDDETRLDFRLNNLVKEYIEYYYYQCGHRARSTRKNKSKTDGQVALVN